MKAVLATTMLIIFLLRTPRALFTPKGRSSWLACGLGGLGFLVADSFIPYATVDAWMGASNFTHLMRNLLLTSAVWFLRGAVVQAAPVQRRPPMDWKFNALTLCCGLVAIAAPFVFADTAGTSSSFVTDRGEQAGVYLYAGIYMAFIALICMDVVWILRGIRSGALALIRLGALIAFVACLDEILYVTAIWAQFGTPGFRQFILIAFNTIYLGVALMVMSLCALAFHPLQRLTIVALNNLLRYHRKQLPGFRSVHEDHGTATTNQRSTMYRAVIELRDLEAQTGTDFGRYGRFVLSLAQRQMTLIPVQRG